MTKEGQYYGRHWGKHKERVGKTSLARKRWTRLTSRRHRIAGKREIEKILRENVCTEVDNAKKSCF